MFNGVSISQDTFNGLVKPVFADIDGDGDLDLIIGQYTGNLTFFRRDTPTAVEDQNQSEFYLNRNFPNPFNPLTTLGFNLPKEMYVRFDIFNMLGQKVDTLYDGMLPSGSYNFQWDGSGHPSGTYFGCLTTKKQVATQKMMLLK